MYGRGLWSSAVAGIKLSHKLKIHARAAYTAYPFMRQSKKKSGKAELKLQVEYKF